MFILPKQITIEEAEKKVVELKNENKYNVKILKLCENHIDLRINVVDIEVYPKGSTNPFDKLEAYKIQCNGKRQAASYLKRLLNL